MFNLLYLVMAGLLAAMAFPQDVLANCGSTIGNTQASVAPVPINPVTTFIRSANTAGLMKSNDIAMVEKLVIETDAELNSSSIANDKLYAVWTKLLLERMRSAASNFVTGAMQAGTVDGISMWQGIPVAVIHHYQADRNQDFKEYLRAAMQMPTVTRLTIRFLDVQDFRLGPDDLADIRIIMQSKKGAALRDLEFITGGNLCRRNWDPDIYWRGYGMWTFNIGSLHERIIDFLEVLPEKWINTGLVATPPTLISNRWLVVKNSRTAGFNPDLSLPNIHTELMIQLRDEYFGADKAGSDNQISDKN